MIGSDQRPDSNWCPLLKLASTDIIISNRDLRIFSNLCPFQILSSVADLLVMVYISDVHIFEKWTSIEKLEKGHRFET